MSLSLSAADLDAVSQAIRVLTSPFDYTSIDAWRSEVNRHLRALLYADSAGFLLPVPDGPLIYSDEHAQEALALYPECPPPPVPGSETIWERMVEVGMGTLEAFYGPHLDRYLTSMHHNEYAAPNKAHDTLAAVVPVEGDDVIGLSCIHLWHSRPDGRRFGEREVALLRLLFPAFQAGVTSVARWHRQGEHLLHMLDGLHQPAVICDVSGRLLHITPSMDELLDAGPDVEILRAELGATINEVCRLAPGRHVFREEYPLRITREVCTPAARYQFYGCLYTDPSAGNAVYAIVGVEQAPPVLPSPEALQERFGLTRRQAEVALLLTHRKTNSEIADALHISTHTARHHTEAVLAKLNLDDRRKVKPAIMNMEPAL